MAKYNMTVYSCMYAILPLKLLRFLKLLQKNKRDSVGRLLLRVHIGMCVVLLLLCSWKLQICVRALVCFTSTQCYCY